MKNDYSFLEDINEQIDNSLKYMDLFKKKESEIEKEIESINKLEMTEILNKECDRAFFKGYVRGLNKNTETLLILKHNFFNKYNDEKEICYFEERKRNDDDKIKYLSNEVDKHEYYEKELKNQIECLENKLEKVKKYIYENSLYDCFTEYVLQASTTTKHEVKKTYNDIRAKKDILYILNEEL